MRLEGDAEHNLLTRLLEDDPHVGPFLAIPGKDNGFDIEGLALDGRRLLLGLRGPVLRGWTMLLELAVEPAGDWLRLAPLDGEGTMLRKHFLQLGGLGVRDLHFAGDDLYILAGPTMVLDGDIRLFRWPKHALRWRITARRALPAGPWPPRSSCRTRRATTAPRPFASCPQDWCPVRRRGWCCTTRPARGGATEIVSCSAICCGATDTIDSKSEPP